jgi:hypothetical protein
LAAPAAAGAEATAKAKAEVAAAVAAQTAANIAATAEAAYIVEAAAMAATAETEAAKLEASARESAAAAEARSLDETKKPKRVNPANDTPKAQLMGTRPSTRAATQATGAGASTSAQAHPTPPPNITNPENPIQEEDQQQDIMDWDLTNEDALLKGSTLSGDKALMEDYPEDETNSKKIKKTNTGKGKNGNPKHKE